MVLQKKEKTNRAECKKVKERKEMETFNKVNSEKGKLILNGEEEILQSDHHLIQSHSYTVL